MSDLTRERENLHKRILKEGIETTPIFPGKDIQRDIVLSQSDNGLDFAMVSGFDNLAQVLETALTTRLGDDIFNINFGFDGINAIAEETNAILQKERIRIAVIRVLEKESRVRRILDVQLSGDDRMAVPPPSVDPANFSAPDKREQEFIRLSRQMDVYVWFETTSGEDAALSVKGLMTNVG